MFLQCFSSSLLISLLPLFCLGGLSPGGSPALALSGSTVNNSDLWSCFNNPAGLVSVRSFSAGTFYESRFLMSGIVNKGAAVTVPLHNSWVTGFSLSEFGNQHFSDRIMAVTFSRKFGHAVNAGLRAEWQSISFSNDYSKGNGYSVTAGMQVRITSQAAAGVTIINPGRSSFSGSQEPMPAAFRAGLKWEVSTAARLFTELEKVAGLPYTIRLAVEYNPGETFVIRAGASNSYIPFAFGA